MKNRNRIDAEPCLIPTISHMHPQIHEQIEKESPIHPIKRYISSKLFYV